MTCDNDCPTCDCRVPDTRGEPVNNITPVTPTCLDCGGHHTPSPCVECVNCDRLFFLRDTHVTLSCDETRGEFWCDSCLEHRFDGEPTPIFEEQLSFEFGHLVNE